LYTLDDGRLTAAARKIKNDLGYKRAAATIEVLALNRKELVQGRAKAIEETRAKCRALQGSRRLRLVPGAGASRSHPAVVVTRMLQSWFPFLGTRRQTVMAVLDELGDYGKQIIKLVPQLRGDRVKGGARQRVVTPRRRRTAYITDITIANFRSIRHLELRLDQATPAPTPEVAAAPASDGAEVSLTTRLAAPPSSDGATPLKAGWKVLLGENGVGKSSILQATALALAGEREVQRQLINWEKLLRRPRGKRARAKEGFVKIGLSSGDNIDLRFDKRGPRFVSGPVGAATYLRAYGPTRNLPNTRAPASWTSVKAMIRIVNLFDPNSPLCSADRWLASRNKPQFNAAALALKDLLRLRPADRLRCIRRRVRGFESSRRETVIDIGDTTVSLDELSDGYQSMVALAVDIMAGMPKGSTDYQAETGIVLLDELGTHLHPRWRMFVVSSLQAAFPRLQFLATTHEPLCLRGLRKGEVSVLERVGMQVEKIPDEELPDPRAMRIDQLLTSRYFGMESTIDPEIDRSFQRYYLLLGKPSHSEKEQEELRALKVTINAQPRALGFTRRDQVVYEVIDEYLARDLHTKGAEQRRQLREETKLKVADIFKNVMLLSEPAQ
jgi:hypothetical protein